MTFYSQNETAVILYLWVRFLQCFVSPAKQKRDIGIAFPASASSSAALAALAA